MRHGKAAYLDNVAIWFDADQNHIHIAVADPEYFHSTVGPDPASK